MVNDERKLPWDRRLAERMARQPWEAANMPRSKHKAPPLKEQIRSFRFWVGMSALIVAIVLFFVAGHGWLRGLAWGFYSGGIAVTVVGNRRSPSRR
jgi:hypothetical protein